MKRLYLFGGAALLLSGSVAAQDAPRNLAVPDTPVTLAFSAVQPGRLYVGFSLGPPVYWREQLWRQHPVQDNSNKIYSCLAVFAGRQLTSHWAAQVSLNGYFQPQATADSQGYYPVYNPGAAPTAYTISYSFGATAIAVPLTLRYNPRLPLGLDAGLEGWLGLAPTWQRMRLDYEQYQNGQPTDNTHLNTKAFDLFATAGVSLVGGAGQGSEVALDLGVAQRLRLAGSAEEAPAQAIIGGLSFRYQLGGHHHREHYRAAGPAD